MPSSPDQVALRRRSRYDAKLARAECAWCPNPSRLGLTTCGSCALEAENKRQDKLKKETEQERSARLEEQRRNDNGRYTPARGFSKNLKRAYGLARSEFDAMIVQQSGRCGLCEKPLGSRDICVDHNHETSAVRELLHIRCNGLLSVIEDSTFKAKAEAYLEKHRE